jgi:N utilization substance protein B
LLFETDFHTEDSAEAIFEASWEAREIEANEYIRAAYFGALEHIEEIDNLIGENSRGWKTYRISSIARAAMRLSVWEMLYGVNIPASVSINEALEIVKKFGDAKAKSFVNGVLNVVKESIEASGKTVE